MANPFHFVQLHAANALAARKFYGALFGWKFEEMQTKTGVYTVIHTGKDTMGIIGPPTGHDKSSRWVPYILVDDINNELKQAQALGAKILQYRTEIPGFGHYALFVDPTGAEVALWES